MKKIVGCIMFATASCNSVDTSKKSNTDTSNVARVHRAVAKQVDESDKPLNMPDSCEQLAEQIMMSTSVFRKLNSETDTLHWIIPALEDGAYTFQLYNDFEDHISTIAWIIVDMKKGKVFQQDIPNDTLLPIPFDKKLVARITPTCFRKP